MNSIKNVLNKTKLKKINKKQQYHTIIIGGGVMGSSIAYQLAKMGIKDIAIVERDNTYTYIRHILYIYTHISACGIRQQFALPENIKLSKYGGEFIQNPQELTLQDGMPVDFQVCVYICVYIYIRCV